MRPSICDSSSEEVASLRQEQAQGVASVASVASVGMWGCEIGVLGFVKQAVGLYLLYLCELRLEMNMRVGGVLTLTKKRRRL